MRPDQFGAPGCVVALGGVPVEASTDHIIGFLSAEFPGILPENVIRRYNEQNLPTSDARVAFPTAEDAARAVQALHNTPIFNTPIHMELV